jgi:hypothetical protein
VQQNPPNDFKNGEGHSLEITFDALRNSVAVGDKTFELSNGNCFVIRITDNWTPTVSQIPAHFDKRGTSETVLEFFKAALRRDKTIQRLTLA